jgi:hypothetical protein
MSGITSFIKSTVTTYFYSDTEIMFPRLCAYAYVLSVATDIATEHKARCELRRPYLQKIILCF